MLGYVSLGQVRGKMREGMWQDRGRVHLQERGWLGERVYERVKGKG